MTGCPTEWVCLLLVCWHCYILFCQINSNLFQQPRWSICLFLIKIKSSFEAFNFLEDHNKVGDKNRLENDFFFFTGTEKGFHWIVSSLFDWKVQSFEMLQSGLWVSLGSLGGRLAGQYPELWCRQTNVWDSGETDTLPPPSLLSERLYFHRTIIKTLQSQLGSNRPFYQAASAVLINTEPALLAHSVQINQQQEKPLSLSREWWGRNCVS